MDFLDLRTVDRTIEEIDRRIYDLTLEEKPHISFNKKIFVIDAQDVDEKDRSVLTYKVKKNEKPKYVITNKEASVWLPYKEKWTRVIGAKLVRDEVDWLIKYNFDEDIYKSFEKKYSLDKLQAVNNRLNSMSSDKRKYILTVHNDIKDIVYEYTNEDVKSVKFTGFDEIVTAFELIKESYPIQIRREIEACIVAYRTSGISSDEKNNLLKVLRCLINIDWNNRILIPDISTIRERLDKTHLGIEDAKNSVLNILSGIKKTGNINTSITLIGGSGTGKTSFANSIAKSLDLPVAYLDVSGINDSIVFRGASRNYSNGNFGMVVRKLNNIAMRGVLVLDNLDEVTDADTRTIINSLLAERTCEDDFLEIPIKLNNVLIIGIAKSSKNISSSALDKSTIIEIDKYSSEEKYKIATDFILPKLTKDICSDKTDLKISYDVIKKLVDDYSLNNSISSVYANLKEICINFNKKKHKAMEINLDNLGDYLEVANESNKGFNPTREINSAMNYYLKNKRYYADNIKNKIESLYELIKNTDERDRDYYINCFYYLTGIKGGKRESVDLARIKEKMNSTHYGLEKVKRNVLKSIVGSTLSDNPRFKPILLDGCAGIGKTTIAKAIAEALDMPFVKVPLNGITDVDTISGFTRSYSGSDAGKIVKALYEAGRYRSVMLLDEIDKMGNGKGDPYAPLHNLLDGTGGFYDKYLEETIPTDEIFFICTSNDKSKIPPTILDRLHVIELEGYTDYEKAHITKEYIVPKILKDLKVEDKIVFDDNIVSKLLSDYCINYGVRDIERAVEDIICNLVLDKKLSDDTLYSVTDDDLIKYLGATVIKEVNITDNSQFGCATALAVSGNTGTTFQIQTIENDFGKELEVTGLPQGSTNESIHVAMTVARNILKKSLPKLHIHFTSAGVKKDGPSAGITIFSSLISIMLKKAIDNVAFTGELDVFGNVSAVGGVKLKIIAAERAGIKKVFIPAENYRVLVEDNEIDKFSLEIVPISSVGDIMREVFDEDLTKR